MFDKYLLTVLQFLSAQQGEFVQVLNIVVEAGIPSKYADEIENELIKKDFVFSTEESGVMINDNGLIFLAKQELGSSENILSDNRIKEIKINKNSSSSLLEKLSWIIGIIAGLLALYEFVIKKMFLHN